MNKVPIVAPNGEILFREISLEIKSGMNLMISGPNGCGKTSIFRVLSKLWPQFGGHIETPGKGDLFFVPQVPYLPPGNLRDQIIYPDTKYDMILKGISDRKLREFMSMVKIEFLVDREGGFDTEKTWKDIFSGGQRQRIAIARMYYHHPKFAVLDECTSAVSVDVEGSIYSQAKEMGITLMTVSHRPQLWKYHEYHLKFDDNGNYTFGKKVTKDDMAQ